MLIHLNLAIKSDFTALKAQVDKLDMLKATILLFKLKLIN